MAKKKPKEEPQSQTVEERTIKVVKVQKDAELLTVSQAAEVVGVTTRRMRQFFQEGRLGFVLGTIYVATREQVEEFAKIERKPGNPMLQKDDKKK